MYFIKPYIKICIDVLEYRFIQGSIGLKMNWPHRYKLFVIFGGSTISRYGQLNMWNIFATHID